MILQDVMSKLESLGTEQTRKTYRRHGTGDKVFGVSFADLKVITKKIKQDHQLACQLWETENADARSLATMILDPKQLDEKTAFNWVSKMHSYMHIGLLSGCIAQSNFTGKVIEEWVDSDNEFVRSSAYDTLACILKGENDLADRQCQKLLEKIEREIEDAPNRTRYSMNSSLIAIGIYRPGLTDAALKCADRIGKVEVDHGDTNCKTPDARAYIVKALSKKAGTKAKAPVC